MSFGSIFNRFSSHRSPAEGSGRREQGSTAKSGARRRRRAERAAGLSAALEALEDRRLLAFQYVGFSHSNEPTFAKSPQSYMYNFEIFNDASNPNDSATMYMRNLAIQSQLQFDYGTTFSSLTNIGSGTTYNWGTKLPAVGGNPAFNVVGPASLFNSFNFDARYNNPDPASDTTENFELAKVRVFARPGTIDPTFILHVGDSMPLALEVDFSQASGTSTIIIRSNATQGAAGGSSVVWLPHGGGYDLLADRIYVQAAMNVAGDQANNFRASELIQIENAVTGPINARVSDGDFKIIAGASVTGGSADIRLGAGVPPSSGSPYSQYGFGGNGGNIVIDGALNAGIVNFAITSVDPRFMTTGPSGLVSGSNSITLNNSGADGGGINLVTQGFSQHNIFAGTNAGPAADIAIDVTQIGGNMTINALPASQATIRLAAPNGQVITNSNVDTIGGLALSAQSLNINRPISTLQGDITLVGNAVTIGSNVSAGTAGIGNLVVESTGGDIRLTSAAVARAPGDAIILKSKGNIESLSRLEATALDLTAGGTIQALSRTDTVKARAGGSITLGDADGVQLTQVTTVGDGSINVTAAGLLEALDVSTGGAGDIVLTTSAVGLVARDLKTKNGDIRLRANAGDVEIVGAVVVGDANVANPTRDLVVTADTGNIVMSPSATVNVADQLSVSAPLGRVLTPGTVDGITVTNAGSGYTAPPTVTISSGSGAAVTPTVGDGRVTFIRITSGGSGYVSAPSVVFGNTGTGGSGAVATAQMTGGVVTGITITNGGLGYTSAPSVSFVGGGGSGAAATATINGLTALSVSPTGSGYQVPPTVVISSGAGGQTGSVTVDSLGAIQAINVAQPGTSFTAAPDVQIVDSSGSGFGATAVANLTGGVTAATLGGSGGTRYPGSTTATVTGGGGSGATGMPLLGLTNASIGAVTDLGTAYAVGDLITVVAGTGAQIAVTQVNGSGAVLAASVTRGGANYGVGDTLYLDDHALGARGLRVTVAAVSNGGAVTAVTVVAGGTGYSTSSRLNHVGGSGAILQVEGDDQLTAITVNSGGSGYTTAPTVTITGIGGEGSGATATAFISTSSGRVTFILVTNPGTGYVNGARVTLTGGGGGGFFTPAIVTPVVEAVATGQLTVVRPGSGYTTRPSAVTGGSGTGMVLSFNDSNYTVVGYQAIEPGSGYTSAPTITLSSPGAGGTAATLVPAVQQVVGSITVTNPGTGYDPATTRITLVPVASGGGATSAPVGVNSLGGITRINLAAPGNGYVAPPTVSIVDRSGSGSGAVATAVTSQGVTGITLTGAGAGYTSAPTVTISGVGGAGSGATAVATVSNGFVTGVTITNPGSGYTAGALVTFDGGGASTQAVAVTSTSFVVTGITISSSGSGYDPATTDVALVPVGSGATGVANVDPATGSVTSIRITDNGSGYSASSPPTVTLVPFGSGALATAAIGGGTVTGVTITNSGMGYAVPPAVVFSAPPAGGTTATGIATIGNVAQLSARRLDWTALEQPLDALLDQFSVVGITLTGAGDLVINRPSSDLTLEKAVTKDGSVSVTAQKLSLNGPVTAGDFNSSRTETVSLVATGADLIINQPVTAPAAVTLSAEAGSIIGSAAGLVTTKALSLAALNGVTVRTKVETVTGRVTGTGAALTIDEVDDVTVGTVATPLTTNNGPVSVTAGGTMSVNTINAGPKGTVTLVAGANLLQATPGDAAEIVAASADLTAKTGRIDLDTNVASLTASAPSSTIDIDSVSTQPLTLAGVVGGNSVRISAPSVINATNVASTSSNVTLTTLGTGNSILVGSVQALKGVATLTATGDVVSADPAGTGPSLLATTGRVSAVAKSDGLINLRTAVGTLAAVANGAITINELDSITLGEPTGPTGFQSVRSLKAGVTVTAGGTITATDVQATTPKQTVKLTSTGGGIQVASILTDPTTGQVVLTADKSITDVDTTLDVTAKNVVLTSTNGSIGAVDAPIQLAVDTVTASAKGSLYLSNVRAISLTSITGADVGITADGGITQTGPISAAALRVTGNGADIKITHPGNQLGAFGATNPASAKGTGLVDVLDSSGSLDLLTSKVGFRLFARVAGAVTQSGPVTAERLTIQGTGRDPITLDTQANSIDRFLAVNSTPDGTAAAPVSIRDAVGDLVLNYVDGSAVSVVAAGAVTQVPSTGYIKATSLAVTGTGAPITLDEPNNVVGAFQATNPGGSVVFKDSAGGLVLGTSLAGSMNITARGPVTQSGPLVVGLFSLVGSGFDPVTLNTQDNDFGRFTVANFKADVSVKDAAGDLEIGFIDGGKVAIEVAGGLTQLLFIQGTSLSVTGTGVGPITLTSPDNKVGSFTAVNGIGDVTFVDGDGGLVIGGLEGAALSVRSAGDMTQSGAVIGESLQAVSTAGAVLLPLAGNDVAAVTGTAAKDFVFTSFNSFDAGPITVTEPKSNIVLKSMAGSIDVVGTLTAPNLVSLSAPLGTFTLVPPAQISAKVLSYDTATPPSFDPAAVPDIIAVNGNLVVNKPTETVTFGNFATSGNITITAASIVVDGPLVTAGAGKTVSLTALTGGVTFVDNGSAEATGTGGTTKVSAAAGAITAPATSALGGSTVTLAAGQAITFAGTVIAGVLDASSTGGAIALAGAKNDIDALKIANGTRAVSLTDVDGLSITSVTGGAVSLSLGGHLTQTGPLVATSATITSTFGNMILTNAANDVGALTIDNATRIVQFTDKTGLAVGGIKAGTLTLVTGGTVTQTGPVIAAAATLQNSAGTITLDSAGNDFGSLAIANGTRDVTVADSSAVALGAVTAGAFRLAVGGNVTQTAAITATSLAVEATDGTVTLTNAANDVGTFAASNGTRAVSYTDKNAVGLGAIQAGAFTLVAGGAVTQSQPATTTTFNVTTTVGGVTLGNTANKLGTLSANLAGVGAPLSVANDGQLQIAQVTTKGPVTVSTINGGSLVIGPAGTPTAKLQTTSTANLSGVAGSIVMANGGTIVAPGGVTVPSGKRIQWNLTSDADSGAGSLRTTLQTINTSKAPSQITYAAPATIKLTSPLPTVLVPLTVVGNNVLTLDGTSAGSTASGLSLAATATASSVSGVTFRNFAQAGVWISGAAASTISGITVTNSQYGVYATGALAQGTTNTTILGSTFTGNVQGAYLAGTGLTFGLAGQGNTITGAAGSTIGISLAGAMTGGIVQGNYVMSAPTAISINGATGVRIGGTVSGQANYVEYATTGVFAKGTCTGTSVVKMWWGPGVTTRYNTSSARGLSIIQ